jgi:hypothetical protein
MPDPLYSWPPPTLSPQSVFYLKVLRGQNFRASFESQAYWENALIIWREHSDGWRQIDERGNYHRSRTPLDLPVDPNADYTVAFVAWHKRSEPDGDKPWIQSDRMRVQQAGPPTWEVGWRDDVPPDRETDWKNIKVTLFHSAG